MSKSSWKAIVGSIKNSLGSVIIVIIIELSTGMQC